MSEREARNPELSFTEEELRAVETVQAMVDLTVRSGTNNVGVGVSALLRCVAVHTCSTKFPHSTWQALEDSVCAELRFYMGAARDVIERRRPGA